LAAQDGLHGAIAFPVAVSDEPLGVMEFLSRETRTADAETLQMLAAIGSQLGQFIHRKRAEEDLRRSRQELRDFVENATVGLHWVGPDGTILWANRAEHELLGYTREEYVGHHIAEFHADGPVIEDILRRLAQKEELNSYEAQLRCKDGSFRHVLISSNVLWDGERFCHTQCFTRDITERKRLEEALRQRADDMTEAARRKDQFLAMLAHELRNPLAPVLYGLRIMQVSDADQRTIENVRSMMERQLHHLTRLVDDLLDVSRITRGMVQVRRSGEGVRRSTDYPKQAG
jgi:PAS domain S-box-containing protein